MTVEKLCAEIRKNVKIESVKERKKLLDYLADIEYFMLETRQEYAAMERQLKNPFTSK